MKYGLIIKKTSVLVELLGNTRKLFFSKQVKKQILVCLLVAINLIFISQYAFAETVTAKPTVISLGNWSLGDTFEVRYGSNSNKTYTYTEAQNLYSKNCYEARSGELQLESNDLQYQQYCIQYDNLCDSIDSYKLVIEQYKSLAQTYQSEMDNSTDAAIKLVAQQNMQQALLSVHTYQSNLQTAVLQKADAYMSREQCLFIKNNASTYKNQQYFSQSSSFRNTIYGLRLIESNYNLQGTYADLSQLKAGAQKISKSKDMSFQSDIDIFNAEYDYYTNLQDYAIQQFNSQFEELLNDANISTTPQGIVISTDIRSLRGVALLSLQNVENISNATDIRQKQLEDNLRILDGKVTILKEGFLDNSNEIKLVQNERNKTAFELNKWLIKRKAAIQRAYSTYKAKYNEIGINEKKAKALYEKYIMLLNKCNFGLTDRTTVKEAELNYMQANYNAWNSLAQYAEAFGAIERYMSGNIQ